MQSTILSVLSLNAQFNRAHQLVAGISREACATRAPSRHAAPQPAVCRACVQPENVPTSSRRQLLGTAALSAPQPAVRRACVQPESVPTSSRRQLLGAAALSAVVGWSEPPLAAAALVQFPCDALNNKYILVRAGESYSEADNVVLTNPAWKTSMAAGLSERGKAQVIRQTIPSMQTLDICGEAGCWLWPSVTQNSYQTAEILAGVLGVGRNRIVPEYSFLDARGVGALEGLRLGTVYQQVWDGDALDPNYHPPKGYDGTPPESVADVLMRMQQLLSVTETQYSGEDVVLIGPDSDTLSILQAAVIGLDLRRHSELAMKPGEVRPLLLSRQKPDTQPRTIPCPRPPACV